MTVCAALDDVGAGGEGAVVLAVGVGDVAVGEVEGQLVGGGVGGRAFAEPGQMSVVCTCQSNVRMPSRSSGRPAARNHNQFPAMPDVDSSVSTKA